LVVNTNMSSMLTQRYLQNAGNSLSTSMQRLSSGLRINSASDDSAGLSLTKKIGTQVSASDVAKRNAQTGINMIQTAESDLGVIQDNLQRMRDLAVQAANGVYSSSERRMLSQEYTDRANEINRIAASSSFSDRKLLNANLAAGALVLQVGTNNVAAEDRIDISSVFKNFQAGQNSMPTTTGGISSVTNAQGAIALMDAAISSVSVTRSSMGATINRLQGTISRIDTRKENMASAQSTIQDTDIAYESAQMTKQSILKQTATAMLQQANQQPGLALSLLQ
ncbi:MAG: flagellin, partial [Candidatus Gastranaerophilales bacterium]|nr:flagellin [Candidatus Gastranaerophilales bacterium]